jgi:hypothetical protein
MEAALVRSSLVLDHGGLAAEALQATVMGAFVRTLSRMDPAVASQTGRLWRVSIQPFLSIEWSQG